MAFGFEGKGVLSVWQDLKHVAQNSRKVHLATHGECGDLPLWRGDFMAFAVREDGFWNLYNVPFFFTNEILVRLVSTYLQ